MCVTQPEACEDKAAIGRIKSECGESEIVQLGANTEQEDSESPIPKRRTKRLPKLIKEEDNDDDILNSLARLFDGFSIHGSGRSYDSEDDLDDKSAPGSPRPKGFDNQLDYFAANYDLAHHWPPPQLKSFNKYYFLASDRLYFFDDFRNLYLEDGTLVLDGSMHFRSDNIFTANFHINEVPYWFALDGQLYHGADGTVDRVHFWQSNPETFDLSQVFDPTTLQPDLAALSPETPELFYDPASSPAATASNDCRTPKTKNELPSSPNSKPLYQTLRGSPAIATSSPDTSSLFEPQPVISSIPIIAKWKEEITQARKDAATARPVRKPGKEERRRCPICTKMFRRPSSLDDHLNVHSGDKPHTCPFKGCNTGFATKSNMKRHFLTHRVGQLENYRPGLSPTDTTRLNKSGKALRAPTCTYNSKAHHTLRFRIAA
ncbi:zinc finger protein [Rhizoctonia solani AG-3 Rhs1AP]|uniref:Zinc finger protein n=2 Tax=Rhizoctonia solani AG-3 TaxID=1086053 RepID=A0A074RGD8_9AGAM|nr:zinc finger protein [Rhizoctonia solani AG-3 Rhs1AP]KEP46196.1 zinc finger protein [Rhizoctonia solani 123E]